MDDNNSSQNSTADGDPCVAEFLARHGIANQEIEETAASPATQQTNSNEVRQAAAAPTASNVPPPPPRAPTPRAGKPDRPPQAQKATSPPQTKRPPAPRAKRQASREVGALRQLRANSIAVSLSKSTQVREKLNEAARFLGISLVSGLLAMAFSFMTTSVQSFVFFAALIALVLGIICVYRSTLIMTRLHRIAKI